jgi:4-carboxymuconolactone decarboxylase
MGNLNYPAITDTLEGMNQVSPALARHTSQVLLGDLWKRPQLSVRDRSIITLAVLIARNQSEEAPYYLEVALDNDVKPGEISAVIDHLAFYSGWANAQAAVKATLPVFQQRGIETSQLSSAGAGPLPTDSIAEERRHAATQRRFGHIAPGLVQLTKDVLFGDLWLQPELSLRDRCLVTICSVIATAQTAQLAFYLNRALDNGVTREELSEVMTHVAFYSVGRAFTRRSRWRRTFLKAEPISPALRAPPTFDSADRFLECCFSKNELLHRRIVPTRRRTYYFAVEFLSIPTIPQGEKRGHVPKSSNRYRRIARHWR